VPERFPGIDIRSFAYFGDGSFTRMAYQRRVVGESLMSNEFGRRRPAEESAPQPVTNPGSEERPDVTEMLFSPLTGRLGAIVGAVVLVVVLAGGYVSNMRGMGRALDDSWSRKTIGPAEASGRDLAIMTRGPCSVRSADPKFQDIQRQLGC
jgi:hypothetical protein